MMIIMIIIKVIIMIIMITITYDIIQYNMIYCTIMS